MPLLGVGFYQFLAARWPDQGHWALGLPLVLSLSGSVSFVGLKLVRGSDAKG